MGAGAPPLLLRQILGLTAGAGPACRFAWTDRADLPQARAVPGGEACSGALADPGAAGDWSLGNAALCPTFFIPLSELLRGMAVPVS